MRDEEDRHAFAAKGLDDPEEAEHFMGRERSGRLVHDEDANAKRERLRDLDGLLCRNGETARPSSPSSAGTSPASSARETSSSAWVEPNRFETPRISRIGARGGASGSNRMPSASSAIAPFRSAD